MDSDLQASYFYVSGMNNFTVMPDHVVNVTRVQTGVTMSYMAFNNPIYVSDLCSCSYAYGGSDYYHKMHLVMTADSSDTGTCFQFSDSDFYVDMNGHTIDGDLGGSDYGFEMNYPHNNLTIKNGVIKEFGAALRDVNTGNVQVSWTLDNVSFVSNSYDVSFSTGGLTYPKSLTATNSDFTGQISLSGFRDFIVDTSINSSYIYLGTVHNFTVLPGNRVEFGNMVVSGTVDYVNFNGPAYVRDLCSSSFGQTGSNDFVDLHLIMNADSSSNGDCFAITDNGYVIDMNGCTISGDDGSSDAGFVLNQNYQDTVIKNGVISDFGRGIEYVGLADVFYNASIDNVTFTSNSGLDVYVSAGASTYDKTLLISNSDFSGGISTDRLRNFYLYGNNIPSGASITYANGFNINLSPFVGDNYVGNIWADFAGCGGSTYDVSYNGYVYTVCDSDVYNSGFTDYAPIVTSVYVGVPSPGGGGPGSGSGSGGAFDFVGVESLLVGIVMIVLYLFV